MAFSKRPMRRAALVQTWGVGAIVPFPHDESLMIAGLDRWRYRKPEAMEISDERLAKRVGVKELRWPPDYRDKNVDPDNPFLKIPAIRFPTWHYCPWCGYCGYGSSSIRERIYCERSGEKQRMFGVLIYTASGDSEGSMGGLVRQGKPGRLEDTVLNALRNATWCASDPVCIQSKGQGPESLNLGACHNCALLPETCCEAGNRLLDRGVVIGTLNDPNMGFFSDVRNLE